MKLLGTNWLEPGRKMPQHRRLPNDAQPFDLVLVAIERFDSLCHVVDMALRIHAAGNR